jgi:glyoxylase-like metal-dependent hydrolase (beta-lactamase superfamily II)
MKVTVINEQFIQLTQLSSIDCYLVREQHGFTLVDTCYRGAQPAILEFAAEADTPITRIVLTHAHVDHVGSLDALRERLPSTEVLISVRERRLYEGDFSLDAEEPRGQICPGWFLRCTSKVDRAVAEGDLIGSLRVIALPGHTPGQIALFDSRNRALIVGDAYSSLFGLSVARHLNLLFPFPTLATWDRKTAFASAEKLIQFEPSLLAPGHGAVLHNPVMLMKAALRRALKVTGSSAKTRSRQTPAGQTSC